MIKIKNVKKKFNKVEALCGVSLDFEPGKVNGLLGPNGCGKTTLIKSILGLTVPDCGSIEVSNLEIKGGPDYRKKVGYMPQISQFPGNLKASELLQMIEDLRGEKGKYKESLINLFEIQQHLHKPIGHLSGGTRQKVSAVLAFMFDPDILILDEPTVGLDPIAVVRLKRLIFDAAKKGKTVVLVTHMISEIEQLVDQLFFILDGSIKFSGTLDQLKQRTKMDLLDEAIVCLMSEGFEADVNTNTNTNTDTPDTDAAGSDIDSESKLKQSSKLEANFDQKLIGQVKVGV
ncbi:MAG: ABC transporter ATP-binding protein [Pseudobdellovibrionaceae bacterium]